MMPCPLLQQNALFCCICVFATVIVVLTHGTQGHDNIQRPSIQPHHQQQQQSQQQQQQNIHQQHVNSAHQSHASHNNHHHGGSGGHNVESRSSYAMLSQAMSQAVSHEFSELMLLLFSFLKMVCIVVVVVSLLLLVYMFADYR